jgi:8-oxo-dGTP diphosphatase
VFPTPSHATARPLGWTRFEELARGMPLPVYALGGLARADLEQAMRHGAHGVALRRGAWNTTQEVPAPGSESSGFVGSSATGTR